jgi:hypothetical protein
MKPSKAVGKRHREQKRGYLKHAFCKGSAVLCRELDELKYRETNSIIKQLNCTYRERKSERRKSRGNEQRNFESKI